MNYSIDELRAAKAIVEKAVTEALKGTPFAMTHSKGTYGDKLEIKLVLGHSDPAAQRDLEQKKWNSVCYLYGLQPEHYGATVTHKGQQWKAVGFETGRSKFPLRVQNAKGDVLLMTQVTIDQIKRTVKIVAA